MKVIEMTSSNPLAPVFTPRSIAVVGASETPGKAAERRTRSLIEGGFDGDLYLINPKRDTLFGRSTCKSLKEVDGEIDLAMIVIPGPFIPDAVEDAAAKGAKGVIIITAGLGETGAEGKAIEARILERADRHGVNVIGPNCSGMFSRAGQVNLLGIPGLVGGDLSILAQSGNIIDSLSHFARRRGRGFSKIISTGNAIGVRFHDYLEYLAEDDDTRVIMMYLESIKFGDEMVRACRRAAGRKPIVALKVGRSEAGQRASASHTGALAADDRLVDAAFQQAGIIRAANVDEMFDLSEALVSCPLPRSGRTVILSEGGGDNSVAADNASRWGLTVPILAAETQDRVRPHLLKGMPTHNPIDYGGTAEENPAVIPACVKEALADPDVDMVYITGFFGGFQDIIAAHVADLETRAASDLVDLQRQYQKPVVVHTSYAREDFDAIRVLDQGGVPVLESSDRAAQVLAALAHQAEIGRRLSSQKMIVGDGPPPDAARSVIQAVRAAGRRYLMETEARSVLAAYGVELLPARLAANADEAEAKSRQLEFPLAAKIVSADIVHKSDAGGVRLNLGSPDEVRSAAEAIIDGALGLTTRDRVAGVLLSPMARPGQEVIIGGLRDRSFGPVVMFGLGGVFVEALKDVSFGIAPLSEDDLDRLIDAIAGRAVLDGLRGQSPKDVGALKELLRRVSILLLENPDVAEIDLNPVIAHGAGCSVVDARIILTPMTLDQ
jgi:acetyltransferase